ncbi:hypothetical protein EVAR_85085_1 [Eumeta japonica]|uniref:Uncharacterized protein n=1 Tax=Eumeta variegata TaxID=151549 RepID=A0A4C1XEG4_EUMVA|nr:hypothetical protein EVAR_85085_1 [Eumeta japonica]
MLLLRRSLSRRVYAPGVVSIEEFIAGREMYVITRAVYELSIERFNFTAARPHADSRYTIGDKVTARLTREMEVSDPSIRGNHTIGRIDKKRVRRVEAIKVLSIRLEQSE